MGLPRYCSNCLRYEEVCYNFGDDIESLRKFHAEKWCNCTYNSPFEMMIDQDFSFKDPDWLKIGKVVLSRYHNTIRLNVLNDEDQHMRFFLKLLKSMSNNIGRELILAPRRDLEYIEEPIDGIADVAPKHNILKTQILNITRPY